MTRRAAVIGHPVAHSRSPQVFAGFAETTGIDLRYEAVDVAPDALAATLAAWRDDAGFVGCNVTIPHKERALALADAAEPAAQAIGAANVLSRRDGRLVADNTDAAGIAAALDAAGVTLRGARVVVFGNGGAARAVLYAAARAGAASLVVAARSSMRAAALAAEFGATPMPLDAPSAADVYVNATSVGMTGGADPSRSLLPADAPAGATAFDLVYTPERTPFLIDAERRGLRTVAGTAMFLAQAEATFRLWFPSVTLRSSKGVRRASKSSA